MFKKFKICEECKNVPLKKISILSKYYAGYSIGNLTIIHLLRKYWQYLYMTNHENVFFSQFKKYLQ